MSRVTNGARRGQLKRQLAEVLGKLAELEEYKPARDEFGKRKGPRPDEIYRQKQNLKLKAEFLERKLRELGG